MHSVHQPLISRTKLLPGESLSSLLIRLTELNFYESFSDFRGLVLENHDNPRQLRDNLVFPSQSASYERLAILTQLDVFSLYMSTHHLFAPTLIHPPSTADSLQLPSGISAPRFPSGYIHKQLRLRG